MKPNQGLVRTMCMSKGSIFGLIAIALVVTLVLAVAFRTERLESDVEEGSRIYSNPVYAYSIEYPESLAVMQYSPEHVSVGRPTEEGLQMFVNAEVALSGNESGHESFDEFIFERGRALCAADSLRETMDCDRIERKVSFVSSRGVAGTEFTMRFVRRNVATGTTTESIFGPVYAFDISDRVPSKTAALFVYVPLISRGVSNPPVSAEGVARSVSLSR